MNTLLRTINTLLLAGILCVLILICRHIREPIAVKEPIAVQGWNSRSRGTEPLTVIIDNLPLEVQVAPR